MKDKNPLQTIIRLIQGVSTGVIGQEVEKLTLDSIQLLEAHKGFIRCNFIVPIHLSDKDGNWHTGAVATLIDALGAAAVYSFAAHVKASLDFSLSYYSTAKIHDEVEIEAKVVGSQGKLTAAVVEVIKKDSRQLIAVGKLWISSSQKGSKL